MIGDFYVVPVLFSTVDTVNEGLIGPLRQFPQWLPWLQFQMMGFLLQKMAQIMKLDTKSDQMWKDKALVELNVAVLYSYNVSRLWCLPSDN